MIAQSRLNTRSFRPVSRQQAEAIRETLAIRTDVFEDLVRVEQIEFAQHHKTRRLSIWVWYTQLHPSGEVKKTGIYHFATIGGREADIMMTMEVFKTYRVKTARQLDGDWGWESVELLSETRPNAGSVS